MMSRTNIKLPGILEQRFVGGRQLASGHMSRVVQATERKTGRTVALKMLHEHLTGHEAIRRRLRRELAATSRLDHRSILRIEELIEEQEVTALVMDFVDGPSVRGRVGELGAMDWDDVRPILSDVLSGLEQAHRRGIWHRDLNAEHILLGSQGAKIAGFGLARVEELVGLTMHTRVLGALEAMAPERILGMSYDGRADLYSVGAVAHELLVGYPPVDGRMSEAFERASSDSLDTLEIPSDLPRAARYVLERSLVSDPSIRFATADQMERALHGEYDVKLWQGWAARRTNRCRQCQTPIIDGIEACIECGHEIRRLVRQPGAGELMIRVISPDTGAESEGAGDLSQESLQRLMELLAEYEDTRTFADGRWEYRLPPYVLFSELTADDAQRISSMLDTRLIPHEVVSRLPGPLTQIFSGEGKSTTFLKVAGFVIFAMIFGFGNGWGIGQSTTWIAASAFLVSLFLAQMASVAVKRRLGSRGEIRRYRGHAFMIPLTQRSSLPDGAEEILHNMGDGAVYRELHELLVLAADLDREIDDESRVQLAELVDHFLDVGQRLQEALQRVEDKTTVELMEKIGHLEVQIQSAEELEYRDERLERHRRYLDEMESHDQATFDVDILKAELLTVRGALLDLRGNEDREQLVLQESSELRHILEAAAEVEELAVTEVVR